MSKPYEFASSVVLMIVLAVGLIAGCESESDKKSGQSNLTSENRIEKMSAVGNKEQFEAKVIAYYFHTTSRCQSCYTIERYTKEAIESNFEDELSSGKLVFKLVNIEEKENEHFLSDYQLYTKSVVLSLVKDGKEIRSKNLKQVWELLRNRDMFYKYIKEETRGFLAEINPEKE